MIKWEYKVVTSADVPGGGIFKAKDRRGIEEYLNGLGDDGWEVVNIDFHGFDAAFSFYGLAKRQRAA